MILAPIEELTLMAVLERGIPNRECVALQAMRTINLGQFALFVGWQLPGGFAQPFHDSLFWFGDGFLQAHDWLFIYTAAGTPKVGVAQDGKSKVYSLHWGRSTTMFANPLVVPVLVRLDGVQTLHGPVDQPQYALPTPDRKVVSEQ